MDAAGRVMLASVALYTYCRLHDMHMNHAFKSNPVLRWKNTLHPVMYKYKCICSQFEKMTLDRKLNLKYKITIFISP